MLPLWCFYIYKHQGGCWYRVNFGHSEPESQLWMYGLTPKKVVIELFRAHDGKAGYYLVNIKRFQTHFCGPTLDDVITKLSQLNGLVKNAYGESKELTPTLEPVDISQPTSGILIFERVGQRFRAYDARVGVIASQSLQDLGWNKRELYQRFLSINGGKPGYYAIDLETDEIRYFVSMEHLKVWYSSGEKEEF